ncbi:hypothetical protein Sinac_5361 [Singulisphaera acidiphila DSM 18658]|uniref:Uncharacterized protein n=1 Tax=Singulisphaera acidiphila (strain ATCC BAA-1392 / DSM 18658 / VKM B-2454 / MOB10) TaxID=886293 RepID=L0DLH3_SINAD|nr:hypothetical protein Sinac_5361 [Singulisphaera acidiphila DSM 18658]
MSQGKSFRSVQIQLGGSPTVSRRRTLPLETFIGSHRPLMGGIRYPRKGH